MAEQNTQRVRESLLSQIEEHMEQVLPLAMAIVSVAYSLHASLPALSVSSRLPISLAAAAVLSVFSVRLSTGQHLRRAV